MKSEDADEQQEGLLLALPKPAFYGDSSSQRLWWIAFYCGIATSVLLNIVLVIVLIARLVGSHATSVEHGFKTELKLATSHAFFIEKSFHGGIHIDHDGQFKTDQTESKYVGKPSKELDDEWKLLLKGLNLDLDADELEDPSSTFQWPESGKYLSGLEVYHSLHCLNRLRQAIYIDQYKYVFDRPEDPSFLDHVDHCINHIRQALQCQSDLTPMEWTLQGNKIILKTDTVHTCRNWSQIHEWASSRQTDFDGIESWKNKTLIIVD